MRGLGAVIILLVWSVLPVGAGDVEILKTVFVQQGSSWRIDTTLRHDDTGWEHYADAWRVVQPEGAVLGMRILYHPHVQEQPFTRSLDGVTISPDIPIVYVEARDKVHGWSAQRVRVNLRQQAGDRFQVKRR